METNLDKGIVETRCLASQRRDASFLGQQHVVFSRVTRPSNIKGFFHISYHSYQLSVISYQDIDIHYWKGQLMYLTNYRKLY